MKLEPMNTLRPSIVSLASEGDILSRFDGKMHSSPMDIKREESPTPRDVLIKTSFVDSKASDLKTTDPALKSKLFQVLDPSQDSSNDFDASDASEDSSESGQPSLPEDKLYGREKEQASLSDTFQRITQLKTPKKLEFVLISGPSGTGKSKLAQSLQERVQAEGGYFCSGKFDQLNQAHPMSPLVAAFNDYVQQIIAEGEESIKRVRAALLREVGSDLWIVAQVMPAIADLVGKENVVDDQCCTGAMVAAKRGACAIHAIKKMMRAISSPERPLVLMLDDLQWATQTPLRKLRAMVTDPLNDGVLFVATCRDDVASNSELSSFLRELEDDEVQITNIALSNLSYPVIAELVEDKLGLPAAKSTAMSEFLFKRSDGNIFFVFEILRWLRDTKVLTCDKKTMLWSMDAMPTCQFCHHSGFLDRKMGMLPRDVQKVLMVASCLGAHITQELMETALQENIEDPLALLVRKRLLVVDDNQETYSFPHDRIQSAAYSLIGVELKPAFHLEIGRRLWKNLGDKQLDCNLFVVLTQLEKGAHIIRDRAMLHEIADLCIRAAEQSVALSSFHIASERLNFAMTLLGENCWDEAYDLSLVLYNHAAEVEVSIGNHDRVEALLKQVLDNAKSFSDQLRAYSTQVYVLGVQGKMNLAIKTGLHVLDQLGEGQPAKFSKTGLYWNMSIICRKLKRKTNRSIRRLPHMTDPKKIAAMQILNMLFLNTFLARPDMFPFVVVKMMKLTLADGLSAISAVAFAGFGMLMAFSGKITQGLKCGQISLDILDDFEARSFLPRCYAFVYGFIRAYAMPWTDALEPLKLGHSVGLSTGDLEFATVNAQFHILFLVDIGQVPLPAIARRLLELRDANEMHGHRMGILKPMVGVLNLISNPYANMLDHSGDVDVGMNDAIANGNSYAVSFIYCIKSFTAMLVEDHVACLEFGDKHLEWTDRHCHTIHDALWMFTDGLSAFARARDVGSKSEKQRLIQRGKNGMRALKKLSKNCPVHTLCKFILVEAEHEAVAGNHVMAEQKFSHAISLARKYKNMHELALCNQVAGNHYIRDVEQVEEGIKHLRAAIDNFEAWGALAAVTHLKAKIEKLEISSKRR